MFRNLNGIRTMNRIPNCIMLVDPNKEKNAVKEAQKLGVPTMALIDTDCDPDAVDLPIPGNDDGIRSIDLILSELADSVLEGAAVAAANARADESSFASAGDEEGKDEVPEAAGVAAGSAEDSEPAAEA